MAAAVLVLSALDADGVVSHVKAGAVDDHVFAGLDVNAVSVGGVVGVPDHDIADGNIPAPQRMQVPGRGILEGDVFQEYALAVSQGNEDRTQESLDFLEVQVIGLPVEAAGGEAGLAVAFVGIPHAAVVGEHAAAFHGGVPDVVSHLAAFEFTPGGAIAVYDTLTCYGNVCGALGMNGREAAFHVQPLERSFNDGIEVLMRREEDDGVVAQVEFRVAAEADGTGEPDAVRHHETSAAMCFQGGEGLLESLRAEGYAIPHRAKVRKDYFIGGDGGFLNHRHGERNILI